MHYYVYVWLYFCIKIFVCIIMQVYTLSSICIYICTSIILLMY
jgi:hypothetical protein